MNTKKRERKKRYKKRKKEKKSILVKQETDIETWEVIPSDKNTIDIQQFILVEK